MLFNNCSPSLNSSTSQSSEAGSANVSSSFSGQATAEILLVSNSGSIWGYAKDSLQAANILNVKIYIDGPVGQGQYAGSAVANQMSSGPNAGHFFTFQLPSRFADGLQRQIYLYVNSEQPAYLLAPMSFAAYTPKAELLFNQQIKTFIQTNCTTCHSGYWNYKTLYSGPLIKPTPALGGTATTNLFIKKMSGQVAHTGGRFCPNGVNDPICTEIQRWWVAEFGP